MPIHTFTTNEVPTASTLNANVRDQVVSQTTAAAKPSGTEGQMIAVTDTDRIEVYSGSAWVRVGHWSAAGRTGTKLRRSATQSISSASDTAISFDIEDFDSDGFIAVTADTITVPSGLDGVYAITGYVSYASSPGINSIVHIVLGGTTGDFRIPSGNSSVSYQNLAVSATVALAATNTVKLYTYQASGGAINVTAQLEMYRLYR